MVSVSSELRNSEMKSAYVQRVFVSLEKGTIFMGHQSSSEIRPEGLISVDQKWTASFC